MATFNIRNAAPEYWADPFGYNTDYILSGAGASVTATLSNPVSGGTFKVQYIGTGLTRSGDVFTGGKITSIKILGDTGQRLGDITGLNLKALSFNFRDGGQILGLVTQGADVINGNDFGNTLEAGSGNDTVNAGGGDDLVSDWFGSDTYKGGAGDDELSYEDAAFDVWRPSKGVIVDLKTGIAKDAWGGTDKISSFEILRGTQHKDTFYGSDLAKGSEGFRGLEGNDVIDGRGGRDWVDYSLDERTGGVLGINADLGKGKIIDGFGDTDTVKNIEDVFGTRFADRMIGNGSGNVLYGYGGNDKISGAAGKDTIIGGLGNDRLTGGTGIDEFAFSDEGSSNGKDLITDFQDGTDRIGFYDYGKAVDSVSDLTIMDVGGKATITYAGGTITLNGIVAAQLTAGDFLF